MDPVWLGGSTLESFFVLQDIFFLAAGAGNQTFLGLVDLLDNLFLQGRVVLFKCHELRTGSYPYITALFSDMIRDGFVQVLPSDSTRESVAALFNQVDHVHITGGAASAHRIMWGDTPEEQRAAIAKGQPRVKAMTAELGNVTPYIICPGGSWTDADLRHHASHLAQFVAANASCNCLSPKAVLISSGWEHYTSFMQYLKEELSLQPLWPSYYPGTKLRYDAYAAAYPSAHIIHAEPGVKPNSVGGYTAAPQGRYKNITIIKVINTNPTRSSRIVFPRNFLYFHSMNTFGRASTASFLIFLFCTF